MHKPDGEAISRVYEYGEGVYGDACVSKELCKERGWNMLCWRVLNGSGWQGDPVTS